MIRVTAAIIEKDGKVLITQRSPEGRLPMKWEFPGGKIEEGETPEECLCREIREELSLDIDISGFFMSNIHQYERGTVELLCYFARITGGELCLNVHADAKWVERKRLGGHDFAAADVAVAEALSADC